MSNYNNLKTSIDANIKQNGNQEITGPILNSILNQMVNILGTGYQFAGVATLDPATNPGTPDAKVFYIANGKGTYTNFGSLEVTEDEVVVLYWDSAWHKLLTGIASQAKLSELDQELNSIGSNIVDTKVNTDLDIADENGNVISRFVGGEIQTKKFNSANTPAQTDNNNNAEFQVADEEGNVLCEFKDGHIKTKNFNSRTAGKIDGIVGKRISILGDSISTFSGWLASDQPEYLGESYAFYYPHSESGFTGLTNVSQMWWKKVIDELGLVLGTNCSWSGSRLIGDALSTTSAACAASNKRIEDLGINGTPDIIVCYIGINDLQKQFNVSLGTLTSKDLWPEDDIVTTLSQGYGLMLSKILKRYPFAHVFCCTLFANASVSGVVARDDDGVYPTKNANGVYLEDVNSKIREITIGYGAHLIDLATCGIHWGNISQVTVDGITHPNEIGQTMMANMIKNELLKYF